MPGGVQGRGSGRGGAYMFGGEGRGCTHSKQMHTRVCPGCSGFWLMQPQGLLGWCGVVVCRQGSSGVVAGGVWCGWGGVAVTARKFLWEDGRLRLIDTLIAEGVAAACLHAAACVHVCVCALAHQETCLVLLSCVS